MGTNQIGRGRSVGVGHQELELRLPKRSASSSESSIVFQRGAPDLTRLRRQAMSTPPKIQAAQQGLAGHIGTTMSSNTQAVATGAIKNPATASSSKSSQANAPIKQQRLQLSDLAKGSTVRDVNLKNATRALMKKFPNTMPTAKSFWDARLTKPEDYKLFEAFAQAADSSDDLEFLKAVSDFRSNPNSERANGIVSIFIEEAPTDEKDVTGDDGLKMQVNLASEDARKKLILTVKTCVEGLSSDRQEVREQALLGLPTLFDSAERYIANSAISRNLHNRLQVCVQSEIRLQKAAATNIPVSPLSFA